MSSEPETSSPQIYTIRAQPLSAEAFAPFGVILSPAGRTRLPIETYGDKLDLYRATFDSDQPIEWFIARFRTRAWKALFFERHQLLTQTFIPLGGAPFLMVVAGSAEEGLPNEHQIHAFIVPGDVAVQLHRATWHENPFALRDEQTLLVTSHAALTRGHQHNPDAGLLALPLDLERRWCKDFGIEIRIEVE
jgi:ureidoglycolate lyase